MGINSSTKKMQHCNVTSSEENSKMLMHVGLEMAS